MRCSGSAIPTLRSMAMARSRFVLRGAGSRYWMSIIWVSIDITGFREVMGSWKTMAIRGPRMARSRASDSPRMSAPSKRIEPELTLAFRASSPRTAEASVVFPQPLSPTTPTMRPAGTVRLTCAEGLHRAPRRGELDGEIADLQDRLRRDRQFRLSLGSKASRRASPRNVKPSVVTISGMPPAITSQGVSRMNW